MRSIICALFVLAGMVLPAGAWSGLVHKTVAELAWRQLDASQRKEITELLKQHPHYNQLLAVDFPKGVDPAEWVFLNGAVWPDLIRPAKQGEPARPDFITKYNIYPHAIDLPVVRQCDARDVSLKKFKVPTPNPVTGLSNSLALLKKKNVSAAERAVALTWVLHLCGDLHQPLHASTLVTKTKPRGHGAGGGLIVLDSNGTEVGLHTYWDRCLGMEAPYDAITALADDLAGAPELRPEKLGEYRTDRTVESWGREGQKIAADFGYSDKHINFVLKSDVDSKKVAQADIPKVSAEYAAETKRIARQRAALAAQRLADALKAAF